MTNNVGYVYGCDPRRGAGGHLWLTVPGSHGRRTRLAATPGDAQRYAPFAGTLALVEQTGPTYFRILQVIEP